MPSAKSVASTIIKQVLWLGMRPFHRHEAWPMKVLGGPVKGVTLILDLRRTGAYWLGSYDRWILDRIRIEDWLPAGGVAWDCGAYVGYYTAIFRRAVGEAGRVITFEASESNYQLLEQTPALNGWTNVEIRNNAVGPDHAELDFAGELGGASGPVDTKAFHRPVVTKRIQCMGVDELCFELNTPLPDFIKFDLEGAETFALHNGRRLFTEKRPVLLLEVHNPAAVAAMGAFLETYGYSSWDVRDFDKPGVKPMMNAARVAEGAAELCNTVVCLPNEMVEKRERLITQA